MFSGIVETLGQVVQIEQHDKELTLSIKTAKKFLNKINCGNSVMIAGVCLTVTKIDAVLFTVDVSVETLICTTIEHWKEGEIVNLERALRMGDTIDGHLVSGHIDAVAHILTRQSEAQSERFEIEVPSSLAALVANKGSICLDGVSLTVNELSNMRFSINVIPYTLKNTSFYLKKPGDKINLEVDLIARYVERCLSSRN